MALIACHTQDSCHFLRGFTILCEQDLGTIQRITQAPTFVFCQQELCAVQSPTSLKHVNLLVTFWLTKQEALGLLVGGLAWGTLGEALK